MVMEIDPNVAEIMYLFRYFYKDKWAPGHIFNGKSRQWVVAFNKLIKAGFIQKKNTATGYEYKWVASYPENY